LIGFRLGQKFGKTTLQRKAISSLGTLYFQLGAPPFIYVMLSASYRFISCNSDRISNLPPAIDHYIFELNPFWSFALIQAGDGRRKETITITSFLAE
jgi:hypothetical protein